MKLKKNIAEMKRRIDDMEEADFDVISGLSGIAHYCFLKEDMYHEILQEIIKLFIQKTNSSSGWKIKNAKKETFVEATKRLRVNDLDILQNYT